MSLYPPAEKRLLAPGLNHSTGGMGAIHGVIVHVIVGTLDAADSVFHNPARQASAHLGVGKGGRIIQWVDTKDKAWAEVAGNPNWISVETEGQPTEALTEAQLNALAAIVKWARGLYGFPLQITDSPTGSGIGTHSMGGAAWGGHACPGAIRAGQRAEIIRRASSPAPVPVPQPPQEDDVALHLVHATGDASGARYVTDRITRRWVRDPEFTHLVHDRGFVDEEWPFADVVNIPIVGDHP